VDAHVVVVITVQLDDVVAPFDVSGVAGHSDDVVEDHVVSQEVEVVLSVDQPHKPLSDDEKEGAVGAEIRVVVGVLGHSSPEFYQHTAAHTRRPLSGLLD
jgi:hypothetical protein